MALVFPPSDRSLTIAALSLEILQPKQYPFKVLT